MINKEVSAGGVTVNAADPLIEPDEAVIVAAPCAAVVARPATVMVATGRFDEAQLTVVRFWVVPSL